MSRTWLDSIRAATSPRLQAMTRGLWPIFWQNASKSVQPKNWNSSSMAPIPASTEAPAPSSNTGGLSPTARRMRRSFTRSGNDRGTISCSPGKGQGEG